MKSFSDERRRDLSWKMNTCSREKLFRNNHVDENNENEEHFFNLVSKTGIKWLEYLETEFDKQFIELDTFFNLILENNNKKFNVEDNLVGKARNALNEISFIFAQLAHKFLVVFDNNSRINKNLDNTKNKLLNVEVENKILKKKIEENFNIFKNNESNSNLAKHSINNSIIRYSCNKDITFTNIPNKLNNHSNFRSEMHSLNDKNLSQFYLNEENYNLRNENLFLQKYILNLKSELLGIRLAAKYFNKELSGRVQQIQILRKSDLTSADQSRLWNQIETEIHLSKHKTVIKACRGRRELMFGQIPSFPENCNFHEARKRQGICDIRNISIHLKKNEGLGISITGGKEFGIPILISEIHQNTSASKCGKLYVGDSILSVNNIDLSNLKQSEAANILLTLTGECELTCIFVISDLEDDNYVNDDKNTCSSKYCFFDTRIMSVKNKTDDKDEQLFKTVDDTEDEDDNYTSITSTLSSPNKMYPGGAKPLISRTRKEFELQDKNNEKEKNFYINFNLINQNRYTLINK